MRPQHDVEIQIAVATAVEAFAALAGYAQPLPVGRALGNARLEGAGDAMRLTLLIELRHREVQIDFDAAISIFDAYLHRNLVILSRHRQLRRSAPAAKSAAAQAGEQVGQIDIVGGTGRATVLRAPVGRRLKFLALRMRA